MDSQYESLLHSGIIRNPVSYTHLVELPFGSNLLIEYIEIFHLGEIAFDGLLALLGAYSAQIGYGLPSIGGKDSMSGTFQDIDVPPTLVSFAVDIAKTGDMITPELKTAGNKLVWLRIEKDSYSLPVYAQVMDQYGKFHEDIQNCLLYTSRCV